MMPFSSSGPTLAQPIVRYHPQAFDHASLTDAKRCVLTNEVGGSYADRWQRETPHQIRLLPELPEDALILDYGCGVGRMAKALLELHPGWRIIGVDISAKMQDHAIGYVNNTHFAVMHPDLLALPRCFDAALVIWTLQHVRYPAQAIHHIATSLKPHAPLLVFNAFGRLVPSEVGWLDDTENVAAMLTDRFGTGESIKLEPTIYPPALIPRCFARLYRKPL